MKRLAYITTMLAVASAPLHAANVQSGTQQGTDGKQGVTQERSESIQLRKGSTKRDATGSDRRSAQERSKERRQTDDITAELQGASIFLPMLQEIERGEVDTGGNPAAMLIQSCKFFTSAQPVPIALGANPGHYLNRALHGDSHVAIRWGAEKNEVNLGGGADGSVVVSTTASATPRERVSGGIVAERFVWHEGTRPYRIAPAKDIARCYFGYGLTIAGAMRRLAEAGAIRETPLKEKVVLVRGDLQDRAAKALVEAMRDKKLMRDIEASTDRVTGGDCVLPTPAGLMQGNTDWQCGPLKVEPSRVNATMGGLTVLGENQFMGQRLSFAQVSGQSTTARGSESRSSYASKDDSNESGRDVSLSKRKSSTRDQSTTTGSSGKADTSATPR